MSMTVRNEVAADIGTITRLTETAFEGEVFASGTEHFIVNALRRKGQLTVSMVAVEEDEVLGHVAVSPVRVTPDAAGWYGLGPISVWPSRQRQGIGSALINAALDELRRLGAAGCVVLGDPAYYGRFGFEEVADVTLDGVASEYFQVLSFQDEVPVGSVSFSDAFDAVR